MKRETLEKALGRVNPRFIADAAAPVKQKRKALPWISAFAAILALVLAIRFIEIPIALQAEAVSLAQTKPQSSPDRQTTAEALGRMQAFLKESTTTFLTGNGNQLYSPINAAIGLATLTELTAGNTRQQLLDTLGVPDTETLARYVSAFWETVYKDNGYDVCTLASSLWLDNGLSFQKPVMDTLAKDYYVSVYRHDLKSKKALDDIRDWLNSNTGDLLRNSVETVQLPEATLLALYSTIYFKAKWSDEFYEGGNTQNVFHSPTGDTTATFMNRRLYETNYYWGDSFGAVSLGLKGQNRMWFILPDSGKTVADVLAEGQYMDMLLGDWENRKYMKVNLSVPKFDVEAKKDLKEGLTKMGITELFQPGAADFSASLEEPAFISAANQAVRVKIDETGVTAAAYIEFPAPGEAPPIEREIIDFILNRPFLFVITDYTGIPLFAGSVQQP